MILIHVIDQIFNPSFVDLVFKKKKSENNMGIKLYNKLSNHLESLENILLFRKNFFIATDLFCRGILVIQIFIMENVSVYDDDLF